MHVGRIGMPKHIRSEMVVRFVWRCRYVTEMLTKTQMAYPLTLKFSSSRFRAESLSRSPVVWWRTDTGFVIGSHQGCEEHAQTGLIATARGYGTCIHVCRKNKQLGAVLGFTELAVRTFVLLLRVTVLRYYIGKGKGKSVPLQARGAQRVPGS